MDENSNFGNEGTKDLGFGLRILFECGQTAYLYPLSLFPQL